ncbi:uncharacterized protein LOC114740590 [Neltuma alba]|uniref:uncharacterized protein LOC114740590 n=1 Tax=Neltuma alba TaxID=207710 RepID=UPI0010A50A13|nr:uncharacterized protein LOC114740590 [Prosopis alba]
MVEISKTINEPWVARADFNAYLTKEDKKGGAVLNYKSMKQFSECVHKTNLMEIDSVGDRFTWERNFIREKIDWAFSNMEWNHLFPFTRVNHLSKFGYDHWLLMVITTEPARNRGRKLSSAAKRPGY